MDYLNTEVQQQIKERLIETAEGLCVTFTKKDGSTRKLRCTLNQTRIPRKAGNQETTRAASTESIPVWDLEANAWRSFRWDSVIEIGV